MAVQHFNTEVGIMQAGASHVREINAQIDTDFKSLLSKLEALFGT